MTVPQAMTPSSRGLGHRPFTAVTGVRIPLGSPNKKIHPKGWFFLFASIFVAADNALVIDRKMPFSDKGLFSVRAGGGRIPEKLLIGAGGRYCTAGVSRICKAKGVPDFCFSWGGEFSAHVKKTPVSRIVPNAAIRLFASMRRRIRIEKRSECDQIEHSALNDDPCRRVFLITRFSV